MRLARCPHLVIFLSAFTLALPAQQPGTSIATGAPPPWTAEAQPPSQGTYPQIVRLSLVEGDVRITRGKHDEKLTGDTWEQAAADIPLQSGFSLVTGGTGRAEIEFEDASTLYLAPDSALTLNELTTKDGVPESVFTLLTGTITTHLSPTLPGERYTLRTPVCTSIISYGQKNYVRLTSYLDGFQITPQDDEKLAVNRSSLVSSAAGKTLTYAADGRLIGRPAPSSDPFAAWDKWVSDRVTARNAAMLAVMKQTGLNTPLPGLADLEGQGTFFACKPYGTCWEPTHGWAPGAAPDSPDNSNTSPHLQKTAFELSRDSQDSPVTQSSVSPQQPVSQSNISNPQPQTGSAPPYPPYEDFPCLPGMQLQYLRLHLLYPSPYPYPYDWAVCHTGTWIFRNHRYVWVSGTHKHHRCPVRWVRYQGKLAFVPRHPRDENGKVPVNLRHGVFILPDKSGPLIERASFDPKSSMKPIDGTPKEFRNPAVPTLARAEAPEVPVYSVFERSHAGLSAMPPRTTLTFDHHTQGFALATRVTQAGHTSTFTEPFSDRGGHLQSGSFHGGAGGGFAGGNRGGAGASGGGSHAGGGGFSGGASHGGGGGFSGGGSSAGASSGGSHR
jgi:hypothetical protein